MIADVDDDDTIFCEACEQEKPLTDECQVGHEADICAECMRAARLESATCKHVWELYDDDLGQGMYCSRCSMVQVSEGGHA